MENIRKIDLVVIGGGPAGLAAAISARENGLEDILVLERDHVLGGILNQCIHNGFGLHTFKEELTGPEYAHRFAKKLQDLEIPVMINTMVLSISKDRIVTAMNSTEGIFQIEAGAIILAMGCRERSRGALNIPGHRPAGIYAAGTAQRFVNMEGYLPGRKVVILGSGDIGLIMARRMTLEGAKVQVVAELMPFSGGLKRNIVQCLDDFDIPLLLSTTVLEIHGTERVTGVTLAKVDENLQPISGSEVYYDCDTLLLSVGLVPENELSVGAEIEISPIHNGAIVDEKLHTSVDGIFACGNVLHVHDLVDFVSQEASDAGKNAVEYLNSKAPRIEESEILPILATNGVRYTVPAKVSKSISENVIVRFRVGKVYKFASIVVYFDDKPIARYKKMIMTPGEMEEVYIKSDDISNNPNISNITISIEEE